MRRRWVASAARFFVAGFLGAWLLACGGGGGDEGFPAANDFAYWLQSIDLGALGLSRFDVAVIDYSRDGDDDGRFTAAEINNLKNSPGGEKTVVAYCSVGEAEDYRWYWKPSWRAGNPSWLGPENPEWEGNYPVRFWDPAWQDIVFAYLDRILSQDFDGVYLDKVDVYEYWQSERPSARADMASFVAAISRYTKDRRPGFLVIPQNGHELIDEAGYDAAIDGIGSEDNYYNGEVLLPSDEREYREEYLDRYVAAGKKVLVVDYCRQSDHVDVVYLRSREKGYVPYCTVRDLDRLVVNGSYPPD